VSFAGGLIGMIFLRPTNEIERFAGAAAKPLPAM
jgi:hypothetical protein